MELPLFSRIDRRGSGDTPKYDIKSEAAKLHWYHCIKLAPGYTTPGIVDSWLVSGYPWLGREVPVSLCRGAEGQVLAGHRHDERVFRI